MTAPRRASKAVPGYRLLRELSRDLRHVVHRAIRESGGKPVLLKASSRERPRATDVEALRRELAFRRELDLALVPAALDLVRSEEGPLLVLEDRGGLPVADRPSGRLDLSTAVHVGLQVSAILAELHHRDVVHACIHPRGLYLHPETREVVLEDFSLASRGGSETPARLAGALPLDLLPYVSPEQTGRMNRTIDHRSDFYSLGVTLYELLTGVRPFVGQDALQLVHAHIARTPEPPSEVRPDLPEALSRIVMKLLEKTAEQRYQSALGLRADLERFAREWSARREVEPFLLGSQDFSERFLLPQRLYGRDAEIRELKRAFDRTCAGATSLMLVSGYSGVGKTTLIQELYRPIIRQHGSFLSGKFDQVVRNIPFGALLQAFRGLVHQLLTESEERLAVQRTALEQALGENGAVLAEVIPEIERIIGTLPPAPVLPPAETQNRFRMVLQDFVGVLASREHPLVVFLDDLQWADAASLDLLPSLLGSPNIEGLLLIGAYRDNEVDESHLLSRAVAELESGGARVDRITLGPLGGDDLARLAADCLHRSEEDAAPLARLLVEKTEGNPFFVRQFLKTLWQDGLLELDRERRHWSFRLEEIANAPMTDNVVELMTRRLERLSPAAQDALTLAACVGNPFDLRTFAVVRREEPHESVAALREALEEGLLLRVARLQGAEAEGDTATGDALGADRFAFLHDRYSRPRTHACPSRAVAACI
ncbi:MAG: hypothetical protein FJ144_20710 [Deltaproteobacteria bacterium]|nr:hypothetical protein [Deltaproteobacteria bacterium]